MCLCIYVYMCVYVFVLDMYMYIMRPVIAPMFTPQLPLQEQAFVNLGLKI